MKSPATLSCFVALVGGGFGCSARAPRPAPESSAVAPARKPARSLPAPVPTPAPASAPASSAAAPASESEPVDPIPAELTALLGNVCQLVSTPGKTPRAGCACCAPFDGCTPNDPPFTGYEETFVPAQVIEGAFTRAGAEQRALPMLGCEPHAANWGGMLLLERGPRGFAVDRYVGSLFAGECRAVRRADGRDLLLCARSDAHQGIATWQLFQWDLAEPEPQLIEADPLIDARDEEWSGCWSEPGQAISSTEIVRWAVRGTAAATRLTVDLDVREGPVTEAYLARCRRLEQMPTAVRPDAAQRPRALLRRRSERRVFRFDGSKFVAGSR